MGHMGPVGSPKGVYFRNGGGWGCDVKFVQNILFGWHGLAKALGFRLVMECVEYYLSHATGLLIPAGGSHGR